MSESNSMGRPREDFDWNLLNSLAGITGNKRYIAERMIIGVGKPLNRKSILAMEKMIDRRIAEEFECTFVEYKEQQLEDLKTKLIIKLIDLGLMHNSVKALTFAIKNLCGWSDNPNIPKEYKEEVELAEPQE